jgi:D-alanyl-D-alanine carboxypeptidase
MYLSIDAAEAWNRMADLARLDGVDLRINSAWRSIEDQRTLMARWASRFDAWSKLEASSRGQRPPKPALPGWSRHQSGVAVDIQRSHDAPDGGGQMVGLTDRWLAANARRFGFSATVPGEPWHFEWVG